MRCLSFLNMSDQPNLEHFILNPSSSRLVLYWLVQAIDNFIQSKQLMILFSESRSISLKPWTRKIFDSSRFQNQQKIPHRKPNLLLKWRRTMKIPQETLKGIARKCTLPTPKVIVRKRTLPFPSLSWFFWINFFSYSKICFLKHFSKIYFIWEITLTLWKIPVK